MYKRNQDVKSRTKRANTERLERKVDSSADRVDIVLPPVNVTAKGPKYKDVRAGRTTAAQERKFRFRKAQEAKKAKKAKATAKPTAPKSTVASKPPVDQKPPANSSKKPLTGTELVRRPNETQTSFMMRKARAEAKARREAFLKNR